MREYGRIENTFWTKSHDLSDSAKLLACYLKSCAHANPTGAYMLPDAYIADDLRWSLERVSETLSELIGKGFCARFADGRHIMVRGFIAAQPPENPNVVKSMIKHFERLPADPLLREISNQILALGQKWVPEDFRKSFEHPSERVSEGASQRVYAGLSQPRTLSRTITNPEPEPEPDARARAGVREAPAPLTRVADINDLRQARQDWAETCGDERWVEVKRRMSVRDWELRLAPCRPNGSTTVLLVPSHAMRKIIEHKHGDDLAKVFGERITFKVAAPQPKENRL